MRFTPFALISLIAGSHALPWPPSFVNGLKDNLHNIEYLFKRQTTNNNNGGSTQATPGAASNSGTPKTTAGTATISGSTQTTGVANATITNPANSNGTEMFDPRDPAGGISMLIPNQISGAQYYKIGDWVTFQWNYTSLQATPTAINVVASCSANNQIYTLVSNQSLSPTQEVLWDTGSYQQTAINSLLMNTYTLMIWDAAKPMTATPSAGYLGTYNQFTFGMYLPQPYQNLTGGFTCPTCNGAASLQRMTLTFLFGMVGITFLSFTWFVTNLASI